MTKRSIKKQKPKSSTKSTTVDIWKQVQHPANVHKTKRRKVSQKEVVEAMRIIAQAPLKHVEIGWRDAHFSTGLRETFARLATRETEDGSQAPESSKSAATTSFDQARRESPPNIVTDVLIFKALADGTRARIFRHMLHADSARTVTQVAEAVKDVDFSMVARHLKVLARCELLVAEQRGQRASYTINWPKVAQTYEPMVEWMSRKSHR